MNDEVEGKGPTETVKRLETASETELQRLIAALELDEAFKRIERRSAPRKSWYANLPTPIWVAIIAAMVPITGGLVAWLQNKGQLDLERERFASDRTLELLRLSLDERMPEAMRSSILGVLAANGDPLVTNVAKSEKLRVDAQLVTLEKEKNAAQAQLNNVEKEKSKAQDELTAAPQTPAAIRQFEALEKQADDKRLQVQVLKYRLGQGTPPALPEIQPPARAR